MYKSRIDAIYDKKRDAWSWLGPYSHSHVLDENDRPREGPTNPPLEDGRRLRIRIYEGVHEDALPRLRIWRLDNGDFIYKTSRGAYQEFYAGLVLRMDMKDVARFGESFTLTFELDPTDG